MIGFNKPLLILICSLFGITLVQYFQSKALKNELVQISFELQTTNQYIQRNQQQLTDYYANVKQLTSEINQIKNQTQTKEVKLSEALQNNQDTKNWGDTFIPDDINRLLYNTNPSTE